nr:uncharacterized mitochondrial protein AtMg00810-like [Tanacetum cinerariifolium]
MASVVICLATEEEVKVLITPSPSPPALQDPTPTPHDTPPQDQHSTPHASPPQEQPTTTSKFSMSILTTLMETCATLSQKVAELEQDKHSQALEILQLKKRVKKLKKRSVFKIEAIDADEGITLVNVEKDEEVVAMDAKPQGSLGDSTAKEEGGCIQTWGKIESIDADEGITLVNVEKDEEDEEVVAMDAKPQGRTPQQNGIAERKNRTLIEAAKTMLADSLLPIPFWAEAVNTTCFVQNRVLVTKPKNKTLYELLHGHTPSIGFIRPFGCPVTILNTLDPLGKFEGKVDEGFLVGYSVNSKAFKVFNSRTHPLGKFDGKADEGFLAGYSVNSKAFRVFNRNQPNDNVGIKENLDAGKVRKETISAQQYVLLPLWFTGLQDLQNTADDVVDVAFNVKENENDVHVSSHESHKSANNKHDEKAKRDDNGKNMPELEDIVYSDDEEDVGAEADLSNLETNIHVSPILTTRVHKDHPVNQIISDLHSAPQTRSMTRMLKEQGFMVYQMDVESAFLYETIEKETHSGGRLDYEEVFAPVERIEAIMLFLAYASFIGFMVYQMDVKSTFLYETIEEEVYVCQPLGFEDPDFPNKIYKVVKALYGLHQAPKAWYETLTNYLLENGFQRGKIDQTLFIKKQKSNILLGQDKYVDEILRKFGLTDKKSASIPIDTKKPLLKDPDGEDVDVHTYRSMIGSLMYLTSSRPDIMFAVCVCARFQVTPKASHLHAIKRIFRYLKGEPHLGLWYPKDSPFNLVAYLDSDYAGASLDRKSTTGGRQFLGCRLISWQCKKQTVVATSSTEAEYVAAPSCCAQVLWIQNQLLDYGPDQMVSGKDSSNLLMADNLPKNIWYSTHHVALIKSSLVQKQMALGKDESNPFIVDSLLKTIW